MWTQYCKQRVWQAYKLVFYKFAYDLANLSAVPGHGSLLGDVDFSPYRVQIFDA